MNICKAILLYSLYPVICFSQNNCSEKDISPGKDEIFAVMKRATAFMVEKVSYKGGYVWSYLPDLSRRWGEMEAYETMIWIQPPGTPKMGHIFLDAYHATNDGFYYQAAQQVAKALIEGQLPCGGWNYMVDFAGEESVKDWYNTIGANGWRLEEFQHYYGNATFDDGGTAEAATFLLRMYLESKDNEIKEALDKVIGLVLESQYPFGGWPQRYPLTDNFSKQGRPDYTSYLTFNDDVAKRNIYFLLLCYHTLGDTGLLVPIHKAMDAFVALQMRMPQPGWAMQYSLDLKPAGARTYEPLALSTCATESNLFQLMYFYRLTGDRKFIERIPEAIAWLESIRLPANLVEENRIFPTFVEIGTNKPLYIHRRGSNVTNGEYFADYNPVNTISHYHSMRFIDIDSLGKEYSFIKNLSPEKVTEGSILKAGNHELPQYFTEWDLVLPDLYSNYLTRSKVTHEMVKKLVEDLNQEGYWPATLIAQTNPYIGTGPKEVTAGDFSTLCVGDKYDTSPYINNDAVIKGISTGVYIKNMKCLIEYVVSMKEESIKKENK
jgi:PelA/Pel-15E family pectate lyase